MFVTWKCERILGTIINTSRIKRSTWRILTQRRGLQSVKLQEVQLVGIHSKEHQDVLVVNHPEDQPVPGVMQIPALSTSNGHLFWEDLVIHSVDQPGRASPDPVCPDPVLLNRQQCQIYSKKSWFLLIIQWKIQVLSDCLHSYLSFVGNNTILCCFITRDNNAIRNSIVSQFQRCQYVRHLFNLTYNMEQCGRYAELCLSNL